MLYRTSTAAPTAKVQAVAWTMLAAVLLPLINIALGKAGLPAVEAGDLTATAGYAVAAYTAVVGLVAVVAAYLRRPAPADKPVPDP